MAQLAALVLVVRAAIDPAPIAPPEVKAAAAEAGVDAVDLLGALVTTGESNPLVYLYHSGELEPPLPFVRAEPPPRMAAYEPPVGVWDRLAVRESTSNWHANTGNGYFGGVQMDMTFWRRHGGLAYAARPDLATRAQQIAVAQRGLAVQGFGAWPACSRRLGLR